MSNYYAENGQMVYEKHREACQAKGKILKVGTFIAYATQHILEDEWSHYATVGRFKQEVEYKDEPNVVQRRSIAILTKA